MPFDQGRLLNLSRLSSLFEKLSSIVKQLDTTIGIGIVLRKHVGLTFKEEI